MLNVHFDPFPKLQTSRLHLRALEDKDIEGIFELRINKEVAEFTRRPVLHDYSQAQDYIDRIRNDIQLGTCMYWVITLDGLDNLIGTMCLWNFSHEKMQSEIGYEFLPDYQGFGYAKESLDAVLEYGFTGMGCQEIVAVFYDLLNTKSLRLVEKTGFKLGPAKNDEDTITFSLPYLRWNESRQTHQP